ncbi:MAG: TetR/AcrR family transcriptional regulator [Anaerolineae bacterium]|nr:TetR/AcrR family transcriptional regulator [Anaerolineae bacterium]
MLTSDWTQIHTHILQMEEKGLVTRTFRRLDPARRQVVIDAILEEAVEKGPASINIKEVARRAGVSIGSLYMYFNNRDGLLTFATELCARFMVDMFESIGPMLADMPLRDGLMMYLTGGIEWSRTMTGLIAFFARAAYQGDPALGDQMVRPIANSMRQTIKDMLTQAIARGEVREDIDLEATTRIIHALTIVVGDAQLLPYLNTYFQVIGEDVPPERTLDAMLDMVLSGIGAQKRKGRR